MLEPKKTIHARSVALHSRHSPCPQEIGVGHEDFIGFGRFF